MLFIKLRYKDTIFSLLQNFFTQNGGYFKLSYRHCEHEGVSP
jgi:hypothetical protein